MTWILVIISLHNFSPPHIIAHYPSLEVCEIAKFNITPKVLTTTSGLVECILETDL